MRGQYLTVEYIIFFLIGISLVISVYFIFSSINEITETNTVESQLKSVGEMVRGTIINALETSSSTNSEIYYNLSIPVKLSSCIYSIEIYNDLNLNCTSDARIGVVLSLYNLNITAENIIYSTNGYVNINAKNEAVELK
jgi:predicted aldo/keto reductase-like oxidoreductase